MYCHIFPARADHVLSRGFVVAYKILAVGPLTACCCARLTLPQVLGSAASFCSTLNLGIRRCVGQTYKSKGRGASLTSRNLNSYVIWRDMNKIVVWVLSAACVGHAVLVAVRELQPVHLTPL